MTKSTDNIKIIWVDFATVGPPYWFLLVNNKYLFCTLVQHYNTPLL